MNPTLCVGAVPGGASSPGWIVWFQPSGQR